MQVETWGIDLSVCSTYCLDLYSQCASSVTTDGVTISTAFESAGAFCVHMLDESASRPHWRVFVPSEEAPSASTCLSAQAECTAQDYVGHYSECDPSTSTREYFYELRDSAQGTCHAGAPTPAPLHGLPCGVHCDAGLFLKPGMHACSPCEAGTFSVGGGVRVTQWEVASLPTSLHLSTRCERTDGTPLPVETCGWQSTAEYARSGPIADNQRSVLELHVSLVRAGAVLFHADVSSETNYDGLLVSVDGVVRRRIYTQSRDFAEYQLPLDVGSHTITFTYEKDDSGAAGADAAFISLLEVTGLSWADEQCTACAPGYHSEAGAAACSPCPYNTFAASPGQASPCVACGSDQFAYPGSTHCEARAPCGTDDREAVYGACEDDGMRTLSYRYIEPQVCAGSAEQLPAEDRVPCAPCQPGFSLERGRCVQCPSGHYRAEAGADFCEPCPAGTHAVRQLVYRWFEELPDSVSTGCEGDCGSPGWRFLGALCDSGVGHGHGVDSWLTLDVTLEQAGTLEFDYSLVCEQPCKASLDVVGSWISLPITGGPGQMEDAGVQSAQLDLWAGRHQIKWTFHRYQAGDSSRNDRLRLHSLRLSGVGPQLGGGVACAPCAPGSAAAAGSETCAPCAPGHYAAGEGTDECAPCEENTAAREKGATSCLQCGEGTHTSTGSAECSVNGCRFSTEDRSHPDVDSPPVVIYDLSAVRDAAGADMFGPIYDRNGHQFFLSVCTNQHSNHTCFDRAGEPLLTFACQQDLRGLYMDLGNVMGYSLLPDAAAGPRDGLQVHYTGGTTGCQTFYGAPRERSATVNFRCDPRAGVGYPRPIEPVEPENAPCTYQFEWASLYACPLCSMAHDYWQAVGECTADGMQTLQYLPREQPPRCHDGERVPPPEQRPCTLSTFRCPAGRYLGEDGASCEDAQPGQYTVGGGFFVYDWSLQSELQGNWVASPSGHELLSVAGTSSSSYLANVVDTQQNGLVSFQFKVSHGADGLDPLAGFSFLVDGQGALPEERFPAQLVRTTHLEYVSVSIPLRAGIHLLTWRFRGGVAASAQQQGYGALVRNVQVLGTSYAALRPSLCPGGYYSEQSRATTCKRCPANTYSHRGAAACTPCSTRDQGAWSLAGSTDCTWREPCTAHDYEWAYTACVDGTRTRRRQLLQPQVCVERDPLLPGPPETLSCVRCPDAATHWSEDEGACVRCPAGQYLESASQRCVLAAAGRHTRPEREYFAGEQFELPTGWSTGCSGDCAEQTWRARGDRVDSGLHHPGELDSFLAARVHLTGGGELHLEYRVVGGNLQNGIQLLIDDHLIRSLPYHPVSRASSLRASDEDVSDAADGGGEASDSAAEQQWTSVFFAIEGDGEHKIVFNYHQVDSLDLADRSVVELRNIRVVGDATGGAVEDELCLAGTYSEGGTASCLPCPVGHYSNSGASACSRCPAAQFTTEPGSARCYDCPPPSHVNSDQSACVVSNQCAFSSSRGNYTFSTRQQTQSVVFGDSLLQLSICQPKLGACGSSHSCVHTESGASKNYGSVFQMYFETDPSHKSNEMMVFKYSSSESCTRLDGLETTRSTNLFVHCSMFPGDEASMVEVDDITDCQLNLVWYSIAGCRVCEKSDYQLEESKCENSQRTTQLVRISECNGPEVKDITTESCFKQVPFPWWAAVVVLVGVILLIIGVVIIGVRHKRLQTQYEILINETPTMGTLDPSGNDDDHL